MEHNTDRILWTVLILAIGVVLYVGFRPAANGLLHQGVEKIQTVAASVNDDKSNRPSTNTVVGPNLLTGTSDAESSGKSYDFKYYQISGGLQPGTTYTLSGWARVDQKAMDNQQHVFVCAYTNNWSWYSFLNINPSLTEQYNKITFTTPSGNQQFNPVVTIYLSHPNGKGDSSEDSISGTGYISKLKLEKGSVATPYSP